MMGSQDEIMAGNTKCDAFSVDISKVRLLAIWRYGH